MQEPQSPSSRRILLFLYYDVSESLTLTLTKPIALSSAWAVIYPIFSAIHPRSNWTRCVNEYVQLINWLGLGRRVRVRVGLGLEQQTRHLWCYLSLKWIAIYPKDNVVHSLNNRGGQMEWSEVSCLILKEQYNTV